MNTINTWNTLATWDILQNVNISWFRVWNLQLEWDYIVNWFNFKEDTENNKYKNPFNDWYSPISYYLRGWSITLDLIIRWETKEKFIENINALRSEIFEDEVWLYLEIWWITKKVKVNCKWNPLNFNHYNITFLKTTLTFSYNDFLQDLASESITFSNINTSFIMNLDNNWTQETELDLVFVFWSWTNLTKLEIQNNWKILVINEPLVEWDILEISNRKKEILKNWVRIDFDWELLMLDNNGWRYDLLFTGTVLTDLFALFDVKYR